MAAVSWLFATRRAVWSEMAVGAVPSMAPGTASATRATSTPRRLASRRDRGKSSGPVDAPLAKLDLPLAPEAEPSSAPWPSRGGTGPAVADSRDCPADDRSDERPPASRGTADATLVASLARPPPRLSSWNAAHTRPPVGGMAAARSAGDAGAAGASADSGRECSDDERRRPTGAAGSHPCRTTHPRNAPNVTLMPRAASKGL
mmetsp:Transcript_876/g.3405  ORF Transcript_876/g.3405 Transcript_876/m.3405 type:complete len:203 (-) Transcript_876:411-1019(-)